MAELYDEDMCCDYPTVNFYGAAQNADVATAEIALGYGIPMFSIPYPKIRNMRIFIGRLRIQIAPYNSIE